MNPLWKLARAHWLGLSLLAVVGITTAVVSAYYVKGKNLSSSANGSVLSAAPNPITVCPGAVTGSTTLSWNISTTTKYELYQGIYPGGSIIGRGAGSGQKAVTGTNNGSTYSLVGITTSFEWQYKNKSWNRVPVETRSVLASVQIMHTTQGCIVETTPLTLSVVGPREVTPGQSYTLSAIQGQLPFKGSVDVKSTFCPTDRCNPSAVYAPWVTFDQAGTATIPVPATLPLGSYKAQVRPAGATAATWSNEIIITVLPKLNPPPVETGAVSVTPSAQQVTQGQSYTLSTTRNSSPFQGEVDVESIVCTPGCSQPAVYPWIGVRFGADGKATISTPGTLAPGTYKARIRPKGQTTTSWSNQFVVTVVATEAPPVIAQLTIKVNDADSTSVTHGQSYTLSANVGTGTYTGNQRQLDYQLKICASQVLCGQTTTGAWGSYTLDNAGKVIVPIDASTSPGIYKARFRPRNKTDWSWSNEVSVNISSATPVVTPNYVKMADSSAGNFGHAYGPAIVKENGIYHVFFCSQPGPNGGYGWDSIRYISSTDGVNWSTPVVKVTATPTNVEGLTSNFAACDPNIVYFGGYYYMYYSNAHINENGGNQTIVNVARSSTINGDYAIYTVEGAWVVGAKNPKTILRPAVALEPIPGRSQAGYGAGQQTVVVKGGQLYMWYTDDSEDIASADRMRLRISNDPVSWMDKQVHRLNVIYPGEFLNSVDVVYDQSSNLFRMLIIGQQHADGANLATSTSVNGISWTSPRVVVPADTFPGFANNPGIERDRLGNKVSNNSFVGFGAPYDLRPNDVWGEWDLYGAVISNLFN